VLFLESGEEAAYGFARGADHLADLFVVRASFIWPGFLALVFRPAILLAGELAFRWPNGEDEVADFAAGRGIIAADVLRDQRLVRRAGA